MGPVGIRWAMTGEFLQIMICCPVSCAVLRTLLHYVFQACLWPLCGLESGTQIEAASKLKLP
jgi:hypothetical protein